MSGISYESGKLQIDVDYLASAMDKDDYKSFIKGLALDSFVIGKVIDYICDEDVDGFWHTGSNVSREEILKRIEKTQLSKDIKYNWSLLSDVENSLKKLASNKSMYYKVHHCEFLDERQKSALLDGEDCEYKTNKADEQIKEIHKILQDGVDKLAGDL